MSLIRSSLQNRFGRLIQWWESWSGKRDMMGEVEELRSAGNGGSVKIILLVVTTVAGRAGREEGTTLVG